MLVHVLTRPRTIMLEAEGYVLRFRPSPSSQPLVDFLPLAECADLADSGQRQFGKREMDSREVLGCLGMLRMKQGVR